jgi:hypothetical protein
MFCSVILCSLAHGYLFIKQCGVISHMTLILKQSESCNISCSCTVLSLLCNVYNHANFLTEVLTSSSRLHEPCFLVIYKPFDHSLLCTFMNIVIISEDWKCCLRILMTNNFLMSHCHIPSLKYLLHYKWCPYLQFLSGPVDPNTKLKTMLNGGNMTQILDMINIKCRKWLNRGTLNGVLSVG